MQSYDCHSLKEDPLMTMTRLPLNRRQFIATGACAVVPVGAGPLSCVADFGRFGTVEARLTSPDPADTESA